MQNLSSGSLLDRLYDWHKIDNVKISRYLRWMKTFLNLAIHKTIQMINCNIFPAFTNLYIIIIHFLYICRRNKMA